MRRLPFTSKGFVCFVTVVAPFVWPWVALAQEPVVTSAPAAVIVEWTTESEVNHAGFNLYRSESPEGPYIKLNDTLIPASPDPVAGGSYVYTDTTVSAGVTYYYRLEDVELDGSSTTHGPIEVVAQADTMPQGFDVSNIVAVILLLGLLAGAALVLVRRGGTRGPNTGSPPVEPDHRRASRKKGS